jgi:CheY-like chemotaxis protein
MIHLILTDLNMPNLDGYKLTLNIKNFIKEKNLFNIPILSFSSVELDENELI